MEPIISPWVFYAINLCATLNFFGGLCLAGNVGATMFLLYGVVDDNIIGAEHEKWVHWFKISLIPLAILVLFELIMPTKEVLYQMLAAYYVTPDNITAVQGNIADFVTQIAKGLSK